MSGFRRMTIWTAVFLSCLIVFTFADDVAEIIQAVESNAKIEYNGKEVSLGIKPVSVDGYNYLSVRAMAMLFNKNIDWDQNEQKILISDKPDPSLESMKAELAAKDKSIAELEEKILQLKKGMGASKAISLIELQDIINNEYGGYDGVNYWVILSGNEDEIRVKIEVDLSNDANSWNRMKDSDIIDMIDEIHWRIYSEYDTAKVKGYIVDISSSKKLFSFISTPEGDIEKASYRNHNTISKLEDGFNKSYCSYFNGMHFTFALNGNDNIVECNIYTHLDLYERIWDRISDKELESFLEKLYKEIDYEFGKCYINGFFYDIDGSELAYFERLTDEDQYIDKYY